MSITALDIINRSLSKIGVKSAGITLTDDEISDSISELNDMMTELDASGIKLGYTIISSSTDEITTPDWTWGAIRSNLAIRLAPEYGAAISQALVTQAIDGYNTILQRTVTIERVQFPTTLPIGAGNEYWNYERFFTDEYYNDILTGSHQTLATDENINIQED